MLSSNGAKLAIHSNKSHDMQFNFSDFTPLLFPNFRTVYRPLSFNDFSPFETKGLTMKIVCKEGKKLRIRMLAGHNNLVWIFWLQKESH